MSENTTSNGTEQKSAFTDTPLWKVIMWPFAESGRILFLMLMMFLSFYATGIAGIGVVLVGTIITGTRIFDGITDPLMGMFIDKTQGKFGKVRPFAIGGYIAMVGFAFLIFFTTHHIPEGFRLVYFIVIYALYMLAYSTMGMAIAVGNPVITKNPKQRPVIFGTSMIVNLAIGAGFAMYVANVAPRHGGFSAVSMFHEILITFTILSAILFTLGLIAIWKYDRIENFTSGKRQKVTLKDMFGVLKGNRALQMFVATNVSDRLANNVANAQVVNVMLFGIIIGDFAIMGTIQGVMLIPNIITLLIGVRLIGKIGAKKAYLISIWAAMAFTVMLVSLLFFGDPTLISFERIGFMTIAFVVLNFGFSVTRLLSQVSVGPMRPDIIDYETYRTGNFAPGIIVAADSFIDKMVVAFYQTLIAVTVASIGFTEVLPDLDTPLTNSIFWVTMFLGFGILLITWVISLICMKFYPLDAKKMVEVQTELKKRAEEASAATTEQSLS